MILIFISKFKGAPGDKGDKGSPGTVGSVGFKGERVRLWIFIMFLIAKCSFIIGKFWSTWRTRRNGSKSKPNSLNIKIISTKMIEFRLFLRVSEVLEEEEAAMVPTDQKETQGCPEQQAKLESR